MFCKKCGHSIEKDAKMCEYCGYVAEKKESNFNEDYNKSKVGVGILMGLFIGLIGLIVGFLIYPEKTLARKSFIKSWAITYVIRFCLTLVILAIVFYRYGSLLNEVIFSYIKN